MTVNVFANDFSESLMKNVKIKDYADMVYTFEGPSQNRYYYNQFGISMTVLTSSITETGFELQISTGSTLNLMEIYLEE